MFYLSPRGCTARAADRTSGHLQNMCFTMFRLLGHQKRRVFVCLGRNGSDGQACHVPGASRPSKSSQRVTKGSLLMSLFDTFAVQNNENSVVLYVSPLCGNSISWKFILILVGYAQTAVVGIVLLTGSTVYTELSGRSWTSKFRSQS